MSFQNNISQQVVIVLMKIYCWEVSLIFEHLVTFVKTSVNFHHFCGQKC